MRLYFQLLRRLRQENCSNPGGRGCKELRSRHCIPAWVTERDSVSEKKKEEEEDVCCRETRYRFTKEEPALGYLEK